MLGSEYDFTFLKDILPLIVIGVAFGLYLLFRGFMRRKLVWRWLGLDKSKEPVELPVAESKVVAIPMVDKSNEVTVPVMNNSTTEVKQVENKEPVVVEIKSAVVEEKKESGEENKEVEADDNK